MNDESSETDYRECLEKLLAALECEKIENFMIGVTPDRCHGLGRTIAHEFRAVVYQRDRLKEIMGSRNAS